MSRDTTTPKIAGYRLKPHIDRFMVDSILKLAMPKWSDDPSVYFIKGHLGGCLVAKMRELEVLDLWFTPFYEGDDDHAKAADYSGWLQPHHLAYYVERGLMTVQENAPRPVNNR